MRPLAALLLLLGLGACGGDETTAIRGTTLRVGDLAALAGLSDYQFEERIRAIFQLTAGQFIQQVRMENAMRLLRATEQPIAQIALECGYSDQSAFTRQFRQTTGMPPTGYRATAC